MIREYYIHVHEDILFWAFRYALGRSTYAVADVTQAILEHWGDLHEQTQYRMQKEIREAIDANHAGDGFDVRAWELILELPCQSMKI